MGIRGTIQYVGSPEATAKELRAALKEELPALVEKWHGSMLPVHFTTRGEKDYHFQPRDGRYTRYKAKRFGHRNPLQFTGDLKAQVSRMIRVSSTGKGARGVLSGPRYLYQYRKNYKQPDKAAELTVTSEGEVDELAKLLDARLTGRMNDCKEKSQTAG